MSADWSDHAIAQLYGDTIRNTCTGTGRPDDPEPTARMRVLRRYVASDGFTTLCAISGMDVDTVRQHYRRLGFAL